MDLEKRISEAEKKFKDLKKKKAALELEKTNYKKILIANFMLEGGDPLLLLNGKGQTFEQWLKPADLKLFKSQ